MFSTVCFQNGPAVQDQLLLKQDMLHVMEVQRAQCERQSQTLIDETEHWKAQCLQTKQDFTGMPKVLAVLSMLFYTHKQSQAAYFGEFMLPLPGECMHRALAKQLCSDRFDFLQCVTKTVSAHTHNVSCISRHTSHGQKEKKRKEKKRKEKKRKEKTTPFGVNLMRSQVLYRAAQTSHGHSPFSFPCLMCP